MVLRLWGSRAASAPQPGPDPGRVSVVIPLYNHARFIADAVDSVLGQGDIVREIIVVDDGSSDGSVEVMRRLCELDHRIIFWSQPNRGAHAAINAGLHRSTGDVIAILNSDDEYGPSRLTALAGALDDDPTAGLAASALAFINDAAATVANPWYEAARGFYDSCGDLATALINGNFLMTTSNFVIRRSLLDRIGLFAPLRYMHDVDFALRVVAADKPIVLVDKPLLRYRLHAGNTIREDHRNVRVEWAATTAFFLARLAGGPERAAIDWRRMTAVADVLQRHELSRAVQLCMMYFARYPSDTLERSPFFDDREFQAALRECL